MPLPTAKLPLPARPPTELRLDSSFTLPPDSLGYHEQRFQQSGFTTLAERQSTRTARLTEPARCNPFHTHVNPFVTAFHPAPRPDGLSTASRLVSDVQSKSMWSFEALRTRRGPGSMSTTGPSQQQRWSASTNALARPEHAQQHLAAHGMPPSWSEQVSSRTVKMPPALIFGAPNAPPTPFSFYSHVSKQQRASDRNQSHVAADTGTLSTATTSRRFVPSASYASKVIGTAIQSRDALAPPTATAMPPLPVHSRSHATDKYARTESSKRAVRRLPKRAIQPSRKKRAESDYFSPPPTRFRSEHDPSPDWLRDALYGPSFEDLQAIRGVVDEERRKDRRGGGPGQISGVKRTRSIDVGWDFARWEAALERKMGGSKRRRM
ncbi:hypothetical protein C6P46_004771 [Rhodotorula mucilaginosa]|uniref:Uncharacterized protein n=1 Tax=Rhodotorula mucilaginosa TaxID=5537 RepID=A0A9P6VZ97_RHOMI|nr:hypothetical protein C6P46_004771 [Rhodotorula mucilaginosa]